MEIAQKSLYKLDNDVAIMGLFFATAYLAGSKRFVEVFPTANRQGLMFAAATSSLGLEGSRRVTDRIGLKKGRPTYLVYRSLMVAVAALLTTPWVAKTFGKGAEILGQDVGKFAHVTTGVIVGTHLTRHLRPSLREKVNLEKLSSDISIIEDKPLSEWKMSRDVDAFNPEEIFDSVGDANVICVGVGEAQALYKSLFLLNGERTVTHKVQEAAIRIIDRYSGGIGDIKWYLNKALLYLVVKKQAFEGGIDQTPKKKEELLALIRKTMVCIEDAHNGCADQQATQMKWLMIEIVDDFGFSTTEKIIALELEKYRAALIDTCVNDTGEGHGADLGVDLARAISIERGFPITRATQRPAVHSDYNYENLAKAKKAFDQKYNPVGYLVEQAKYYTKNKVFPDMCQWYGNQVFPEDPDDKIEEELKRILGCDFSWTFERKDSAVLYYLFKNGLITT
ncbi:hypothetical protein [Candidatus Neptunichlamydia sp. REUL1]|uniref:hypothetical protein n=1 Tax=Candidatus Neptunichlamydia sp. REUL1 TaxID=3064277 RepID=UPI00293172C6|nr:hypothetical protein [Candidatus Neptunochlamydia sp. REUL1]